MACLRWLTSVSLCSIPCRPVQERSYLKKNLRSSLRQPKLFWCEHFIYFHFTVWFILLNNMLLFNSSDFLSWWLKRRSETGSRRNKRRVHAGESTSITTISLVRRVSNLSLLQLIGFISIRVAIGPKFSCLHAGTFPGLAILIHAANFGPLL